VKNNSGVPSLERILDPIAARRA